MSAERVVYSIQQTYIVKLVPNSEKRILTCDERIDIPTIESLSNVKPVSIDGVPLTITVIPCIELAGEFLSEFDLMFETNEGVTVLPVRIPPALEAPSENPYTHFRYVLALPSGATGVKSCKLIHKSTGKEAQHNFTFGIMPPPYNYDNALFGVITSDVSVLDNKVVALEDRVNLLKVTAKTPTFEPIVLPKGAGKQTINIEDGVLFYTTGFSYSSSQEPTTHNPKITLHGGGRHLIYTLSLNKTTNTVLIDLFTGRITVYEGANGEIMQEFVVALPYNGFETLTFENFDDINTSGLYVTPKGARVV